MLVILPPFKGVFLHMQASLTKVLVQFLPQTHHQCLSCFISWPNIISLKIFSWFLPLKTYWIRSVSRLGSTVFAPQKWLFDIISFSIVEFSYLNDTYHLLCHQCDLEKCCKHFLTLKADWPVPFMSGFLSSCHPKWLLDIMSFVPGWISLLEPQTLQLASSMGSMLSKNIFKCFQTLKADWVIPNWSPFQYWGPQNLPPKDGCLKKYILFMLEFSDFHCKYLLLCHQCDL